MGRHRYTPEQIEWLGENRAGMVISQLAEAFNQMFSAHLSKDALERYCNYHALAATPPTYTPEQNEWLRENRPHMTGSRLTREFNRRFGTDRKQSAVEKYCVKLGVHRPRGIKWTAEHESFISSNIGEFESWDALAKALSNRFDARVSKDAVRTHAKEVMGLKGITKGQAVSTARIKAYTASRAKQVGAERKKDGITYVKYARLTEAEAGGMSPYQRYKAEWMPKARYLYIRRYGEIPPNHNVIHLDGDKKNFEISNLYLMPHIFQGVMNKCGWFSDNPDITLAALKLCELMAATKELEEISK